MKKLIAIVALTASFAASAFAYSNLVTDGIVTLPELNTKAGTYDLSSDGFVNTPINFSPYTNPNFSLGSFNITNSLNYITANGGSVNVIFIGETAGYTLNEVDQSGTVIQQIFSGIQTVGSPTIAFGDYKKINVSIGNTIDIALKTEAGYNFSLFNNVTSNVSYLNRPLYINETLPGGPALVATYLLGIEDLAAQQGPDWDYNDVIVALQFFDKNGTPITPVPESSTYGLIGAAGLLGLVLVRRFKSKK
jgi:hypothetical protein